MVNTGSLTFNRSTLLGHLVLNHYPVCYLAQPHQTDTGDYSTSSAAWECWAVSSCPTCRPRSPHQFPSSAPWYTWNFKDPKDSMLGMNSSKPKHVFEISLAREYTGTILVGTGTYDVLSGKMGGNIFWGLGLFFLAKPQYWSLTILSAFCWAQCRFSALF